MTYGANWSKEARSAMSDLDAEKMSAVRAAVTLLRGRMPEVGGTASVEGTNLEISYEIQPKKVLGILGITEKEK